MDRRKLIFFVSADPASNTRPIWSAYHFATVAATAGLEAEVRLAGDAVKVALPDGIAQSGPGDELRDKMRTTAHAGYQVSL